MNMLSDEQITTYQMLYKNRFGKKISREKACEDGESLIQLMKLIYKPITEAQYQQVHEHRRKAGNLKT